MRVFEISVDVTEREACYVAWQINANEEVRIFRKENRPQQKDGNRFGHQLCGPAHSEGMSRMMGEMASTPKTLRKTQQETEIQRVSAIQSSRLEERQMDKVVRD